MEHRLKKIASFILLGILLGSCDNNLDLKGFIYAYEPVNARFHQSMQWNYDHPYREITVPDDNYLLYVMGDSHVGGTKNLDAFFNDAINARAVAAVMVGDLTSGHAEDYQTFKQHLPPPDSLLTFPIAGNHDLYFDGWKQFFPLFGSSTYLFTVKTPKATDLFICLDSGSGTLGNDQLDWLKSILRSERPGYRHCVIFSHVNLFRNRHTSSTNPLVEELYVLMDLSVRYQIDMVITGHDHVKNVEKLGNTTYLTMDALLDGSSHAGYLKLSVKQGNIEYEFINL